MGYDLRTYFAGIYTFCLYFPFLFLLYTVSLLEMDTTSSVISPKYTFPAARLGCSRALN